MTDSAFNPLKRSEKCALPFDVLLWCKSSDNFVCVQALPNRSVAVLETTGKHTHNKKEGEDHYEIGTFIFLNWRNVCSQDSQADREQTAMKYSSKQGCMNSNDRYQNFYEPRHDCFLQDSLITAVRKQQKAPVLHRFLYFLGLPVVQ